MTAAYVYDQSVNSAQAALRNEPSDHDNDLSDSRHQAVSAANPGSILSSGTAAKTGGGRLAGLRGMLADESGSVSFGGDEASRVAGRIADHSLNEGLSIPGIGDDALHDYVAGVMRDNPGYAATRGRTVWWDGDRGAIIIRQGTGGTAFTPDRGYQCFLDQLAE